MPGVCAGLCVIRSAMKKIFLLGLLLLTSACQTTAPTATSSPLPTITPPPPTPIPFTSTPAPTSTPSPSPTPLPRYFTTKFDVSLAGWVILQAGSEAAPNVNAESGKLQLRMDIPYTWLYALYGAHDYDNVRVDTQFVNNALTPVSIGLICRYSEAKGWFEYNISTDGTYNVLYGKWLANGIVEYLPITFGSSKEIQPSGSVQQIGLTCSDTTLLLYIDNQPIRQVNVSRYELSEGKVGIAVASYENVPVVTAFDWVKIEAP